MKRNIAPQVWAYLTKHPHQPITAEQLGEAIGIEARSAGQALAGMAAGKYGARDADGSPIFEPYPNIQRIGRGIYRYEPPTTPQTPATAPATAAPADTPELVMLTVLGRLTDGSLIGRCEDTGTIYSVKAL